MIDWDHILEITQKNAVQMCVDYINNKYTENYKWDIPLRDGVKITIIVKRIQKSIDLEVYYEYHDNNKNIYPIPHEYCYAYSNYMIEDTAKDFIYAVRGIWDYEDEE